MLSLIEFHSCKSNSAFGVSGSGFNFSSCKTTQSRSRNGCKPGWLAPGKSGTVPCREGPLEVDRAASSSIARSILFGRDDFTLAGKFGTEEGFEHRDG